MLFWIFDLAVCCSLVPLFCLFVLSLLSLSLSLSLSLLSLSLSLFSLYSFPSNSLAYFSVYFVVILTYLSSLSSLCSFFSFLSDTANHSPSCVVVFVSFFWRFCCLVALQESKANKPCLPAEKECFGGLLFGLFWDGETLKQRILRREGGGSPTLHIPEENIKEAKKKRFKQLLLCFLCSFDLLEKNHLCYLLLLIYHFQKIVLAAFLHPFEKHKLLTSVSLCFNGCFLLQGRSQITSLVGKNAYFCRNEHQVDHNLLISAEINTCLIVIQHR